MNQRGFTLIELVVVIVILGILAVTAVPKFLGIQSDARISTLKGIEGSIKAAVGIANAKAELAGGYPHDKKEHEINGIKYYQGNPVITVDNLKTFVELDDSLFVKQAWPLDKNSVAISFTDTGNKVGAELNDECILLIRKSHDDEIVYTPHVDKC